MNPLFPAAIARSSKLLQEALSYLSPAITRKKKVLLHSQEPGQSLSIAIETSKAYFGFPCSLALHELLRDTFPTILFSYDDVERVIGLAQRNPGARAQLAGGVTALRERSVIQVGLHPSDPPGIAYLTLNESAVLGNWIVAVREVSGKKLRSNAAPLRERIDADTVDNRFIVRPWKAGDTFIPLGMSNKKKISDFLTDQKVSHEQKRHSLIMESAGTIIWVCGHRINNNVRVQPSTSRVLELSIKHVSPMSTGN